MKRYLPILLGLVLTFSIPHALFADTYTVTGTVDPTLSNFPFSLTSGPIKSEYRQDDIIQYTINYGTTMGGSVANYTIIASWNNDTPPTTGDIDILDYVSGSGSNAYNNTPPVVDLIKRQISWTVPSLLGPITNQTVSFQLKLNNNYQANFPVNFSVFAHIVTPYLTTTPVSLLQKYQYDPTYLPYLHAPSPTPAPAPQADRFTGITVKSITATQAEITASTYYPTTVSLFYNTSMKSLTNRVDDTIKKQNHNLVLTNLQPHAKYYFQVIANDGDKKLYSEFYTFTTAQTSQAPHILLSSVIITQNNNVLYSNTLDNQQIPEIILPTNTTYELTFGLDPPTPLLFAEAHVVSPDGQTGFGMSQKQPNEYSGELTTGTLPQQQDLTVKIADTNGNLLQQKIANIKVIDPLQVTDKATNQGIEHAKVELFVLDSKSNSYKEFILNNTDNPLFTDTNGIARIALPTGSYKAVVSATGYKTQEAIFTLEKDGYPQVQLQKQPWSLLSFPTYLLTILLDFVTLVAGFFLSLTPSKRLFDLFAFVSLSGFVLLSFVLFYLKTHFHFKSLPQFVLLAAIPQQAERIIVGKIIDTNNRPLTKVHVYLLDRHKTVLKEVITNKNGIFVLPRQKEHCVITCLKEGFEPESIAFSPGDKQIIITLGNTQEAAKHIIGKTAAIFEFMGGLCFEFVLLLSLLLEIGFIQSFGIPKVLPFLSLSLLNVVLGIMYLKDRGRI